MVEAVSSVPETGVVLRDRDGLSRAPGFGLFFLAAGAMVKGSDWERVLEGRHRRLVLSLEKGLAMQEARIFWAVVCVCAVQ